MGARPSIQENEEEYFDTLINDDNVNQVTEKYTIVIGRISSASSELLEEYSYDDPKCEVLLKDFYWERDFSHKNGFGNVLIRNTSMNPLIKGNFNYETLENSITKFCNKNETELHIQKSEINSKIFKELCPTLSDNDAKGCALAVSFYTGNYSERVNRVTNAVIRSGNSLAKIQKWPDKKYLCSILHYLTKALSILPMHWGKVTRCVDLDNNCLKPYKKGNIVTWLQFSSSSEGDAVNSGYFRSRNTRFIIYSYSGRKIAQFSNFTEEREVLFPPYSNFIVMKKEFKENKNFIYLRQIEISLAEKNILWVDDNILDKTWENKLIIEDLYLRDLNIKIIPKVSTECAISYLKSMLADLDEYEKSFKIVSDMNRLNENPFHNAGVRLFKEVQKLKLSHLRFLIFTSDKQQAIKNFEEEGIDVSKFKNLKITTWPQEAINFMELK